MDRIAQLSRAQQRELANWFDELLEDAWDAQIEQDVQSGRLDDLIAQAETDIAAGRVKPLDEVLGDSLNSGGASTSCQKRFNETVTSIMQPKAGMMTKEIEAIYEGGILRPLEPLDLPEGSRLEVILVSHDRYSQNGGSAASILAEIAALPQEGASDHFSGKDHDSVLYPEKPSS